MSSVIAKNVQVGTSGTATNNFTLYQPASPDGTVRLGVGNTGATTLDAVTVTSAGNVAVPSLTVSGNNISAVNSLGFRNRIINGDMRIDQRNAGASVTIASTATFGVDRWQSNEVTDGAMTVQQSTVAPSGFSHSQLFTTTTADASLANDQFVVTQHKIEGFNVADLGWGTASAQAVTLSFWVRSSITGTFGGVLQNEAQNRTYPFTYSISSANTWEQKTVTIAGDTTGTWVTNNGTGIRLIFDLGSGPNLRGTAGAWAANGVFGVTGAVSPISTLSATWQITGVQLEAGTVASPFERRDYGRELIMCQRYYYRIKATSSQSYFAPAYNYSTTLVLGLLQFPVSMRAAPTSLETTGTATDYQVIVVGNTVVCNGVPTLNTADFYNTTIAFYVASTTAGQGSILRSATSNAYLGWSAEL